jgi:hypothetical protein
VCVSVSDTRSNLDIGDIPAELANDTDTLMAESHPGQEIVLVCAAETGVCCLNVDLVGLQGAGGLVGHDISLLGAAENLKSDAHYDSV